MDSSLTLKNRATELFSTDISNPSSTVQALRNLRAASIRQPHLDTFVQVLQEQFEKLPRTDEALPDEVKTIFAAMSDLAEKMMEKLPTYKYHNYPHTLTVTANRLMLGLVEHKLQTEKGNAGEALTAEELYRLARGCLICLNHDNGHNGVPNKLPLDREEYSYSLLDPILQKHGISDTERKFIERVTLFTDPRLPGEILKYAASIHGFSDNILSLSKERLLEKIAGVTDEGKRDKLTDLLNEAEKNRPLVNEALLTKAADMGGSFGLSQEYFIRDGGNVLEEEADAGIFTGTLPINFAELYKRQYWALLNFVGAEMAPDGMIISSFMHETPNFLFGDVKWGIEYIIHQQLPDKLINEVQASLKDHGLQRRNPGINRPEIAPTP